MLHQRLMSTKQVSVIGRTMRKVFMPRNLESITNMVLLSILHVSACVLANACCLSLLYTGWLQVQERFTVQIATYEDNIEDCRVFFMNFFGQQKHV